MCFSDLVQLAKLLLFRCSKRMIGCITEAGQSKVLEVALDSEWPMAWAVILKLNVFFFFIAKNLPFMKM